MWLCKIYLAKDTKKHERTSNLDILLIVGKLNSLHNMNKKINALGLILFEISVLCKMFDIMQLWGIFHCTYLV